MSKPSSPAPAAAASPEATAIWNDVVAPKYADFEAILVRAAQAHSDQIWSSLDRLPSVRRIVDVGCGSGDTTRRLAEANPTARVTGLDCAEPLLALARQRHSQVPNLEFVLEDAGRYRPEAEIDLCFSRIGLMFFERPVQTLRWIRSWLSPQALLGALVWQAREKNPWLNLARDAVLEHVRPVDALAPTCGPGPFSMADAETTAAIFERAGFSNVRFTSLEASVQIGESPEEAARFQLAIGPAGEIMRHAVEANDPGIPAARASVVQALARTCAGPAGGAVVLPSSSWWIEATA
jgi:ubiquinone/menaquinone biosynthesis C-methylase UbiE